MKSDPYGKLYAGQWLSFVSLPSSFLQYPQRKQRKRSNRIIEQFMQLSREGKHLEAIPVAEKILAIYEKLNGPDHRDVATALSNLAGLHYDLGDYRKAQPLYQRSLEIRKRFWAPIILTLQPPCSAWQMPTASPENMQRPNLSTNGYSRSRKRPWGLTIPRLRQPSATLPNCTGHA